MPFTFLHAADLHLDTPFSSVGTTPADVLAELREASLRAWTNLVAEAVRQEVAFVVLAGDIYDGAERGLRAQRRFLEGLTQLHDQGIRTFVAYGNHDPVGEGWAAITTFPPSVTIFPAARAHQQACAVTFEVEDEPVTVTGISYAQRNTTENLVHRFPRPSAPGLHVAVLHANVGGDAGHHAYSPCTLGELRAAGYHYWALGHIHRRSLLSEGPTWVAYPGDLQGRSPKPAECEAKGALVVDATASGVTGVQFVPLDVVRFLNVAVDIAGHSVETLLEALATAADPAAHDGRSLIVRAAVTGCGPLHHELHQPERRDEVLEVLRLDHLAATPFTWWNDISWATRPATDYEQLARGNDFIADLLTLAHTMPGGPPPTAPSVLPAEVDRLLRSTDDEAVEAPPSDTELLAEAARVAVDAVLEAPS